MICYNCERPGHIARDCPMPDQRVCRRCGETGHLERRCSAPNSVLMVNLIRGMAGVSVLSSKCSMIRCQLDQIRDNSTRAVGPRGPARRPRAPRLPRPPRPPRPALAVPANAGMDAAAAAAAAAAADPPPVVADPAAADGAGPVAAGGDTDASAGDAARGGTKSTTESTPVSDAPAAGNDEMVD